MIFKRFSFHRKKPELCNICKQEMLKNNFYSKDKILLKPFSKGLFEYTYRWVFVFPGPWPFTWPPILALAPGPCPRPWPSIYIYQPWLPPCVYRPWHQICIYQPWPPICIYQPWPPACVYPKFVFISSARCLSLHIPTLSLQFVFTGPGLRFVCSQAANLIYPQ